MDPELFDWTIPKSGGRTPTVLRVLGPTLFLIFMNDFVKDHDCDTILFADDIKLWKVIRNAADEDHLQTNLNRQLRDDLVPIFLIINGLDCFLDPSDHFAQADTSTLGGHRLKLRAEKEASILVQCETVPFSDSEHAPIGRSGHRVVFIGGDLYVVGGYVQYASGLRVEAEIWAYNVFARIWRKVSLKGGDAFKLALSTAAISLDKQILINGGTGVPFGENIDNSLVKVDLVNETCTSYPCKPKNGDPNNMPQATYGHTITLGRIGGKSVLFKVGGAMGYTYSINIYAYSFAEGTWEALYRREMDTERMVTERYRHDTALWKEKLYIVGGANADGNLPFWPVTTSSLNI
nr:unnamed protein product [Spirometra erinaceieuropaei]